MGFCLAERHVLGSGPKSAVLPEALLFQDHFDRREIPVLCLRRYFEGAADMLQVLCLGAAFKAADNSFYAASVWWTRPTARTESSDSCSTVEPAPFPPLSLTTQKWSTNQKIKPNRERYKKKNPNSTFPCRGSGVYWNFIGTLLG